MNGILNTGLDFWQFLAVILCLALSVIAIKITFNFDINKYLERRDEKHVQKLKNACTHIVMVGERQENGRPLYGFQSLFESPSGTLQWQCQRCGLIRNHDNDYDARAEYYAKNPEKYIEQTKKFQKILKKSGMV